jgi:hypothetical protein
MMLVLLLAILVVAFAVALTGEEADHSFYELAKAEDLLYYPGEVSDDAQSMEQPLYVVILPDTYLCVILRPISESEYGSFQVQAIGYQMIEQQMLAAAIVLPLIDEEDVVAFSQELIDFLQQQVNAISGFDVFDVVSLPPAS